jgi:fibronectin-binding autotransporter adhesin
VTLTNANGYTGGTTIDAGTLVAGNNSAFGSTGTQTVTFNGGKLGSDNDARSLSNNLVVNNVAGNRITGNSVTLAGTASGAGTLEVAVSAGKSVTLNSGTANGFAPAAIKVTTGTLVLGGDNKLGNATTLELAGGTFATAGFSEGSAGADGLGALTLSATSTIDFGAGASVVRFAGIAQSVADTVLMIANWTGTPTVPGGTDRLLFSGLATDFTNLFNQNEVSFNEISGYFASEDLGGFYEITPVPEPATFLSALGVIGLIGYRERRRISNAMKWGRRDTRLTRGS